MNKYVCLCGYEGRSDNISRHRKKCIPLGIIERLMNENKKMKDEMNLLRHENLKLLRDVPQTSNVTNTTVNNITNNIQVNNILCPSFGSEPAPKRTSVKRVLQETRQDCRNSVPEYIRLKYLSFNGKGNIRILDKNGNKIQVIGHDQNGQKTWIDRDKNETIHNITEENVDELLETYIPKLPVDGHYFNCWYKTFNMNDSSSSEFKRVKEKVECLLMRNTD